MEVRDRSLLLAASVGAAAALLTQRAIKLAWNHWAPSTTPSHPSSPPTLTTSLWCPAPHPSWSPPQPQPPPFEPSEGYHSVDPTVTPAAVMYPLVISSVVPRPIAFISTLGSDGSRNLAPYSYFNIVGHSPPTVAIGFCATGLRDHGKKDSLFNILESREFVVNIISEWFIEAANHCCGNFSYGESEWELSGLHTLPGVKVKAPRVAESAVQLECMLRHTHEAKNAAGEVGSTVVIAEVVMWHLAKGVAGRSPSGKLVVDVEKLKPVSRLGGNTYGRTAGLFDLPRPDR